MHEGPDVMVTMNKVMHNALRRDLDRMRRVLEETAPVPSQRRAAIADHMTFTMARLHHHHTAEDNELWPRLDEKNPSSRETLTSFSEQHAALQSTIDSLLVELTAYAAAPGDNDATRAPLRASLDTYANALLPHLEIEEREAPVYIRQLSPKECAATEKHFREKIAPREQGYALYWLMDGTTAEQRHTVETRVPKPVLWFLKRTAGPAYEKKSSVVWGSSR